MQITIPDEFIEKLVIDKVHEKLNDLKLTYSTVDIYKLAELTGLSRSTLLNKYTCKPEFIDITVREGTRVLYLYPECMEVYRKILKERQA